MSCGAFLTGSGTEVRGWRTIWEDLEVQPRLTDDVLLAHVRPQLGVPLHLAPLAEQVCIDLSGRE